MINLQDLLNEQSGKVDHFRRQHKTCVLAIMFADIVGYTKLCEKVPALEVTAIRHRFEDLARKNCEELFTGLILKYLGDAVIAVFAEPFSAVQAAFGLCMEMSASTFPKAKIQLRIGIHMGAVAIESRGLQLDIFGKHVNRTSRIQNACQPGEILVSEPIRDNVAGFHQASQTFLPRFIRRRHISVKNIEELITVFSMVSSDGEEPVEDCPQETFIKLRLDYAPTEGFTEQLTSVVFDPIRSRTIMIGRDETCDIRIDVDRVSRRHALISYDVRGSWQLQDTRSKNGTFVNGAQVQKMELRIGDRIEIAGHVLVVEDLVSKSFEKGFDTKSAISPSLKP